MKKNIPIFLFLFALLISGKSSHASGFPFSRKIDSIQVVFDDQQLILPGESFRIGIISYGKNGKIKKTVGALGGTVWWWKYKVDVGGGTNFSGRITVNEQLVPSKGKYISVYVFPRKQPELAKELLLPLNYETKITFRPTNQFDKSPGSQIKGEIISEFNNGVTRICTDMVNSPESWFLNFSTSSGSWENGLFIIDPDFKKIENHQAKLVVNTLRNELIADTFAVLLDYKHNYILRFCGDPGSNGDPPITGVIPFARDARCLNNYGIYGQNGQNGEDGHNGPDIGVWVDLYRDSVLNKDLLYVFAKNSQSGEEYSYLINPLGGSLEVTSNGGNGGNGGSGEQGISGFNGADGYIWIEKNIEKQIVKKPITKKVIKKEKKIVTDAAGKETEIEVAVEVDETTYVNEVIWVKVAVEKQGPGYDGTNGGPGGAGGLAGMGGNGGNITLYFTDDAWPYQRLFVPQSLGGSGGMNGSGGAGGRGGAGGHGNPNGRDGANGHSGPSAMGWAPSGGSGRILKQPTEEFFFYTPKEQSAGK